MKLRTDHVVSTHDGGHIGGVVGHHQLVIGLRALTLDLRETQRNAIRTYESRGYTRWGTQPQYALIDGQWIAGHHYAKELR